MVEVELFFLNINTSLNKYRKRNLLKYEIRVDTFKAEDGISAPSFPNGITVTGVVTAHLYKQM